MHVDVFNLITAALLFGAALFGFILAIRGLRVSERDAGRQEASGINGAAQETTQAMINIERIRISVRGLLMLVALIVLMTEPGALSRFCIVAVLVAAALLDDLKSVIWHRARRTVDAIERARKHTEREAANVAKP